MIMKVVATAMTDVLGRVRMMVNVAPAEANGAADDHGVGGCDDDDNDEESGYDDYGGVGGGDDEGRPGPPTTTACFGVVNDMVLARFHSQSP